jgi:hypothetical protein
VMQIGGLMRAVEGAESDVQEGAVCQRSAPEGSGWRR